MDPKDSVRTVIQTRIKSIEIWGVYFMRTENNFGGVVSSNSNFNKFGHELTVPGCGNLPLCKTNNQDHQKW